MSKTSEPQPPKKKGVLVKSPGTVAINAIERALLPLDETERRRVLAYINDEFAPELFVHPPNEAAGADGTDRAAKQ